MSIFFDAYFKLQIKELFVSPKVKQMNTYIQHGHTSTLKHALLVAFLSYKLSLWLPFHFDRRSLIRGALLHDFYLYDWHEKDQSHRWHGFHHPQTALKNAEHYFILSSLEKDIIAHHMWPLTFTQIPASKEAFLICLVDKYCSLLETFYIV